MNFINPYDLANSVGLENLDSTNFKSFKKRLVAELDLFDDELSIQNKKVTKSDCLNMFQIIETNNDTLEHFRIIFNNENLNKLLYGFINKPFLRVLKNQLIVESKEFNAFISPYITNSFKSIYKKAFIANDAEITRINLVLEEQYIEEIYMPVYKIIQDRINVLSDFHGSKALSFNQVKSTFGSSKMIENLPDYFNKIKNDLFKEVRNLSIYSCNELDDLDLALELINFVLLFDLSQKSKNKFLSDKSDLTNIKLSRRYNSIASKIYKFNESLKNNPSSVDLLLPKINLLTKDLNKHDSISGSLRGLSLTLWNEFEDIKNAIIYSKMSLKFAVDKELIAKVNDDLKFLQKTLHESTCWYCNRNIALNSKIHSSINIWKYEKTGMLASLSNSRKYYRKRISVPRCSSCHDTHSNYGFFSFGLKSDLKHKTHSYKNTIANLRDWSIGVGP